MIEIVSSVSVYFVFLLLPGALNSLVTRFKTHFVSRVTLLVVGSSLLFLLDCHSRSIRSMSVVFIDGLSSLFPYNLLFFAWRNRYTQWTLNPLLVGSNPTGTLSTLGTLGTLGELGNVLN